MYLDDQHVDSPFNFLNSIKQKNYFEKIPHLSRQSLTIWSLEVTNIQFLLIVFPPESHIKDTKINKMITN